MRSILVVQPYFMIIKVELEATRMNTYLITVGLSLQVHSVLLVTGKELLISQAHGDPSTQAGVFAKMHWWLSLVATS